MTEHARGHKVYEETLGSQADIGPSAADFLDPAGTEPVYNAGGTNGQPDINDLNLVTETIDVDTQADATQGPPPMPDGIHTFTLLPIDKGKFGDAWGAAREKDPDGKQDPNGKVRWLWAKLEYEANEPGKPFDKGHVFENYVSTMVMQNSGTSRVATLLRNLGVKVPARATHLDYMNLLIDESQKRPAVKLETQWEARCGDCAKAQGKQYRAALRGMKNFPATGKGGHSPVIECKECGTEVSARAQVTHYHAAQQASAAFAVSE